VNGFLGLIILVLDIVAIMDAVKISMDTAKKVFWIALIVILPVIGMALYFLIGKRNGSLKKEG
jgi:hypothetical protein